MGLTLCLGWLCIAGCANVVETRTIAKFTEAIKSGKLEEVKLASSDSFGERALRQDAALDDLKLLRLPTGDLEIDTVEDVSPTVKRVTAMVGASKQKLKYQLKLDQQSTKWVVDDIYLKQKHEGVTATKSVTEQMDLLLSVREFLTAWKEGSRDDVLRTTTPEFAAVLRPLPPAYLNRLTQQVVGKQKTGNKLQTRAQLDENTAHVRLPIAVGELWLTAKRLDGHWLVDEVEVNSREESDAVPSTRQLAQVTHAATAFLAAYHEGDKTELQSLCTPKFFSGSLAPANLSQVPLPSGEVPPDSVQIHVAWQGGSTNDPQVQQLQGKHSDFVVEGPNELIKLSLVREDGDDSNHSAKYLIEDVTLYELESRQEKRLSALFTAQALVQIYAEALASRDLEVLYHNASPDFVRRVWKRTHAGTLQNMPLNEIEDAIPKIRSTVFAGSLTEVTVTQGSRALTYVLQDREGTLLVDDVLMPTLGRPSSLKSTMELMLPVLDFGAGLRLGQLDVLQRHSSRDFNRLVWQQTSKLPSLGQDVVQHLHTPLVSIEQTEDRATLVLGDDKFGAHATLVRESGQFVIDDVMLISGTMPRDHVELKRVLRMHIATFGVGKSGREISPASGAR
ncbi:MAG: hypothetical protein IAG10_11525 [Planctomycetaceae bacterium]|nr:hypothetical protein [Planctomycetaceae bacterium]